MEEERVPRIDQLSTEEVSLSTGTILRKILKSINTLVKFNQSIDLLARSSAVVIYLFVQCTGIDNMAGNTTAVFMCKIKLYCEDWP